MAVTHNSGRIIQHLRDSHPALASLRAQASSSRAKAVSLKGQLLPKLDFVANYYKNGSLTQGLVNNDATRVVAGLSVTVPLFDGFATQSKMKGVLHQAEKSEAELQGIEAQLLNDWSMLQSELINALANLQASARLQDVAEIALDSYQRRLARGEADSIELMSAQAQFLNARQERHRAVSEWHSAKLRLLLLSGGQGSIQVVGDPGAGLTKGP
jgi:outer membrane protein